MINRNVLFVLAGLILGSIGLFQNCSQVVFQDKLKSESPDPNQVNRALSFVMMTKNTSCLVCHTNINGNISGFGTLNFRGDSTGIITGNIYAADQKISSSGSEGGVLSGSDNISDPNLIATLLPELIFENLDSIGGGNYKIKDNEYHNTFDKVNTTNRLTFSGGGDLYTMTHHDPLRRPIAKDNVVLNPTTGSPILHDADFPSVDLNNGPCATTAKGTITTSDGTVFQSPLNGNYIFFNGLRIIPSASVGAGAYTAAPDCNSPLVIKGEVVVNGDLVISGCYKGNGTIYTTGNIYIPNDLRAKASAFPYTKTLDATVLRNEANQKLSADILSLAAQDFIMIGKLKTGIIESGAQDPIFRNNRNIYQRVYDWIAPGLNGTAAQSIFEASYLKKKFWSSGQIWDDPSKEVADGAVALVEANMFSNKGIALSLTRELKSNFKINGSLISPNLSIIGSGYFNTPASTIGTINPYNNLPIEISEINQDFRLKYEKVGYECHRLRQN